MPNRIFHADNLRVMRGMKDDRVELIYMDPPFNTGKDQTRGDLAYTDSFEDYLGFLKPRLEQAHRILAPNGSLFVHLDYREVHYVKIELDKIFGRSNFKNEIIWVYDFGGRPKNKWPAKHDNILWYVKNRKDYIFNFDAMDRLPYMAPGLVGKEKAATGKTPTDVWWHTIVPTNGKEKTGYPTQKPLAILQRLLRVHSTAQGFVLDPFAGSGTTGVAAAELGRSWWLIDSSPDAVRVMTSRLAAYHPEVVRLTK